MKDLFPLPFYTEGGFLCHTNSVNYDSFIFRCLELADRGRGSVGINPLVGSLLVRKGEVVAEGWHRHFGGDHAERELIKKFDQGLEQEDVLYVNLEPCCHHSKTPPCTDLIIKSGIKQVVYGMQDPNPEVAGQGIAALRAAGITVTGPVLPELCRRHNRGFVSLHEKGRPYITLKRAQTKDGRVANDDGSPLTITSEEQNQWSHQHLRAKHDAILVGVQTVISDDPQLTVRLMNKKVDQTFPQPLVIIFDPHLRIPAEAKVVKEGTVIITDREAAQKREEELFKTGARILRIPTQNGYFDWNSLWSMLTTPEEDFYGISSILVEGGQKTGDAFRNAGQYDEEVTLVNSF